MVCNNTLIAVVSDGEDDDNRGDNLRSLLAPTPHDNSGRRRPRADLPLPVYPGHLDRLPLASYE